MFQLRIQCCTRLSVGMMMKWLIQRVNDRYKDRLDGQLTNMFQTYIYSTRKQCDPKKRSCSRQRRRVCSAWNTSLDERKKGVGQSGSYRNDVVKQNQPKVRQFDLTGPPMISSSGKKPWTPFVIDLTYWSYNIGIHTDFNNVCVDVLTNFCCWKSQH